jgi:hypothetical protein
MTARTDNAFRRHLSLSAGKPVSKLLNVRRNT